ncbi:hypothetical protein BN2476_180049 [Paraburkholderia piptadeniae]|uniref:Uncharacterized protein n=1 Tax=Paraburkholderia piptadeniae TaxID=1701573 RepID=A0A1N7RUK1_9BURK|nr:hypothetical protein BN2476_180049 [Paraburkholderia piptadeniae]
MAMRSTSIAFVKAIIVKFGSGMNAKCDNDAVLSGDMIRAFLQLDVLLQPGGEFGLLILRARATSMPYG